MYLPYYTVKFPVGTQYMLFMHLNIWRECIVLEFYILHVCEYNDKYIYEYDIYYTNILHILYIYILVWGL